MNGRAGKSLVVLAAFTLAVACLLINLAGGSDLLHAAFNALWVMLAASLILLLILRCVSAVLMQFLQEQVGRSRASTDSLPAGSENPPPPPR